MESELVNIAEKFVKYGEKLGADEIEIFVQGIRNTSLQNIQGYITTKRGYDVGVGVRAVIGKSVGFASASSIEESTIIETIKAAISIAKNKPEDPDFQGLPDPQRGKNKGGLFDQNIVELQMDQVAQYSRVIEKSVNSNPNISKFSFALSASVEYFAIANSRGILESDKGTFFTSYVDVKGKKDGQETSGLDFIVSRKLDSGELERLGDKAVERAVKMFGAKKLNQQFTGQLLLENRLTYDILTPLEYNISSLNHQNKRSAWLNKINTKVAGENITIYDDGTLEIGYMTMKVDGEGIPMKNKEIIVEGELKNLIYDSYSARKEGKESTGNGIRRKYNATPVLSTTNLVLKPGNKNLDELIAEIEKGVFATTFNMGAHMTDPIKGFFSLTNINAFYVEKGEIKYPLQSVNISGNFFEAINNVISIGNDAWTHYKGLFPSILVDNISFV